MQNNVGQNRASAVIFMYVYQVNVHGERKRFSISSCSITAQVQGTFKKVLHENHLPEA